MALISRETIMQVVDWAYDRALAGIPGIGPAAQLADDALGKNPDAEAAARYLIRKQMGKAAASGFITGLGGLATLPVAVPANISSVLFIQVRLVAAVAHLAGHDLRHDHVRMLVCACLAGSAATDVLKDTGIRLGTRAALNLIGKLPEKTLTAINRKVGLRLVTKAGTSGLVNLGKIVPVVGGLVGGGIDAASTRVIGHVAVGLFFSGHPDRTMAGAEIDTAPAAMEPGTAPPVTTAQIASST